MLNVFLNPRILRNCISSERYKYFNTRIHCVCLKNNPFLPNTFLSFSLSLPVFNFFSQCALHYLRFISPLLITYNVWPIGVVWASLSKAYNQSKGNYFYVKFPNGYGSLKNQNILHPHHSFLTMNLLFLSKK